ncbi:MAG TPA: hypothetical protein DCE08_02670 [Ruminococcaceae bacterium]|nr:hypothetical protein [Oscillospiraceae bacterium]
MKRILAVVLALTLFVSAMSLCVYATDLTTDWETIRNHSSDSNTNSSKKPLDVNGDGKEDTDDAVYMTRHLLNSVKYPRNTDWLDYDGSGSIDIKDAIRLLYNRTFEGQEEQKNYPVKTSDGDGDGWLKDPDGNDIWY